jgi:hypothetical protein
MGFAKQKAYPMPVAEPAPPPVRQTSADVLFAKDIARKEEAARKGNAATLLAQASKKPSPTPKKTLLGQ